MSSFAARKRSAEPDAAAPEARSRRRRDAWVLLIVPLLVVVVAMAQVAAHGPFSLSGKWDPDYNYLLNSLSILRLQAPGHTDHPGTTVQVIGAAPLLLRWLVSRLAGEPRSLAEAVLGDPETYLRSLHAALALIVATTSYVAGRRATTVSGSLVVGIVFQISLFLFANPLRALARVSPEPLLVAAVYGFSILLMPLAFGDEGAATARGPALGAALGFGLVTKATFLPLVGFLSLLPGWRSRARAAVATVATAAVLLVPIWKHLPRVGRWLVSLLTHPEPYGGGAAGLPSLASLLQNLRWIVESEPLLPAWVLFYLGVLAALRTARRADAGRSAQLTSRVVALGCVVIGIQVAMATKHFVAGHYLVPGLVALALPNALVARSLIDGGFAGAARRALLLAALTLSVVSIGTAAASVHETVSEHKAHYAATLRMTEARNRLGDCLTIGYFGSSASHFALGFASEYSSGVHAEALNRLYPETLIYQRFAGEFIGFAWVRRNQAVETMLRRGRCVLLQGSPITAEEIKLPRQFKLTELVRGRYESIYRLSLAQDAAPRADRRPRARGYRNAPAAGTSPQSDAGGSPP